MSSPILAQVQAAIRRQNLFRPGQQILVGVSGGADSIALLALLRELAPAWKLRLTAAHLHHGIRGAEADRDARFVRAFARRLGVGFIAGRKDVPRLARQRGISLEMAGREARYAFFAEAARRRHCAVVATAHTADDQAETILMKLARGTGAQGLAGIPFVTRRGALNIVRPLRDIGRSAILHFLRQRRLAWREDATNADRAYLRNRVRHEIIPFLENKLNPRLRQALGRLADILEKENEWLDALAANLLSECTKKPVALKTDATERVPPLAAIREIPRKMPGSIIDCRRLAAYPQAARRRVLRIWLAQNGLRPETLDFDAVARLDNLLTSRRGGALSLPGGYSVRQRRPASGPVTGRFAGLTLHLGGSLESDPGAFRVPLKIPGTTRLPGLGLRIRAVLAPGVHRERPRGIGHYPARASLSAAAWRRRRVVARSRLSGDRMTPLAMAGSKKVQDIFMDAKVPRDQRQQIPLFECGGRLIWIPGYRIARGWEIREPARPALQLLVERR